MVSVPHLHPPADEGGGDHRGVLVWRFEAPRAALSSAAVGGGRIDASWVMNLGVGSDYSRVDLEAHAGELTGRLGLAGPGITLFTAADVTQRRRGGVTGVTVDATVGVTKPTWAADPTWTDGTAWAAPTAGTHPPRPGTINLVVQLPVPLDEGAAVNAVITATEAKSQVLVEHGIAGTGTASDAVVVLWPRADAVPSDTEVARFAGPRSPWGARLALAVHGAVRAGLETTR
jgi:adenosylcobinamide hydrolase